jgi:uncharacterized OB-fold protein
MSKAVAQPTPDTLAFFDSIDQGVFALPRCRACGSTFLYPRSVCRECLGQEIDLVPASGRGVVESFVVNHRAAPGFEDDVPYVLALIRLEEGPTMMANVLTPDPSSLQVDTRVVASFEQRGDRHVVQFAVTEDQG